MIRAVLLDAGHTLFREREGRGALYAKVARAYGVDHPPARWDEAMHAVHGRLPRSLGPHFRYTDGWFEDFVRQVFLEVAGVAPGEALRRELFATWRDATNFEIYPDVEATLEALRALGLRLAVVSNWTPHLPALLRDLRLAPCFETLTVSAIEGCEKPEPEIFRRTLERLRVSANETVHVGDHPRNDVEGARALGIEALLLHRDTRSTPSTSPSLHSLAELPAWISSRGGGVPRGAVPPRDRS